MIAWELKHRALVSQCVAEHTIFREETRFLDITIEVTS